MGPNYLSDPLVFVVSTLFELYILAVLLRFLLQQVRADFYNPVSQFIVKITQPLLRPLRKVIPGVGGIDWSTIILLVAVQVVALLAVGFLRGGIFPPAMLAVMTVYELTELLLNVYLWAIIIQAILSWVQAGYNPAASLLYDITDPVLRPFRSVIPAIGGLDLSPLVAILAIQVVKMLVLPPIYQLATRVA